MSGKDLLAQQLLRLINGDPTPLEMRPKAWQFFFDLCWNHQLEGYALSQWGAHIPQLYRSSYDQARKEILAENSVLLSERDEVFQRNQKWGLSLTQLPPGCLLSGLYEGHPESRPLRSLAFLIPPEQSEPALQLFKQRQFRFWGQGRWDESQPMIVGEKRFHGRLIKVELWNRLFHKEPMHWVYKTQETDTFHRLSAEDEWLWLFQRFLQSRGHRPLVRLLDIYNYWSEYSGQIRWDRLDESRRDLQIHSSTQRLLDWMTHNLDFYPPEWLQSRLPSAARWISPRSLAFPDEPSMGRWISSQWLTSKQYGKSSEDSWLPGLRPKKSPTPRDL